MRITLVVVALCTLACSGPGVRTVDRPAFTIDLIDGRITDDLDHGNEGDFDVEYGLTTQAMSWAPIEDDETLEYGVDLMWQGMEAIIQADGSMTAPSKPAFVSGTVAGQPSLGFEASLSGATLVSTTWRCPEAGVQMTLNTGGLSSAVDTHQAALDTAKCKTTLLGRSANAKDYRFIGDAAVWRVTAEDEGDASTEWTHRDDIATIDAFPQNNLKKDDDLCEASMGLILNNLDAMTLDPSEAKFTNTSGGCVQDFGGSWNDGSGPVRGRIAHDGCGELGYVSMCLVTGTASLDATCKGVVACAQ